MSRRRGLQDMFSNQEVVLVAEGYIIELERRGYLKNGSFVPEVVLDHSNKVEELSKEFVHCGSDVVQALTYNTNEEKLKTLARKDEFVQLNNKALEIAQRVAQETGSLFAAGVSATYVWDPNDQEAMEKSEQMIRKQVQMFADSDVDYIVCETIRDYGEASLALRIIKEFDIPTVVMLQPGGLSGKTLDGVPYTEALARLEQEGAVCVGFNCARGPRTMTPLIREARKTVKGPLAAVCLGYRTTPEQANWYALTHPDYGHKSFPHDLSAHQLGQSDVTWFGEQCKDIGVQYVGFCCGNAPNYMRGLANCYNRVVPASKYNEDFDKLSVLTAGEKTNQASYNERYGTDLQSWIHTHTEKFS